jgi:hypothetical protein
MPYILNNTNGTIVATVQDASLDLTTDLIFVGRNYAGYGEWQNENFLKLLENFSNSSAPTKPIEGQVWYDTANKKLNVYDGEFWKGVSNLEKGLINPANSKNPTSGDLWYEEREQQLYVYNGSEYRLIGPLSGADTRAQWKGSFEVSQEDLNRKFNLKAVIGINDEIIALVSGESYTVQSGSAGSDNLPIHPETEVVKKGINLIGADPATGVSASNTSTGNLFWGTAAHALVANESSFASSLQYQVTELEDATFYPYFGSELTPGIGTVNVDTGFTFNPGTNTLTTNFFNGLASSARYADLAERYEADSVYDEGTVVVIGGIKEVTISTEHASTTVAGVVSKNPAYLMNSKAGSNETHPAIALKGRVPCKIYGPVRKGELLVTSGHRPGYATARQLGDDPNAVIGKALEDFKGLVGVIEIKV